MMSGVGVSHEKIKRTDTEKRLHHYHCSNVDVSYFGRCLLMDDFVRSFNMNTNKWCFTYLFKRLAWLGNKDVSQFCTLMFLALWHGYFPGYFTAFFFEYIVILGEKSMVKLGIYSAKWNLDLTTKTGQSNFSLVNFVKCVMQKFLHVGVITGYCMIDFGLLKWSAFWRVWKSVYFYGHVIVVTQIVLGIVLASKSKNKDRLKKKE